MSDPGFPNFIKHFRKARKLTLEALGAKFEPAAPKGTISEIENGKKGVSMRRLFEIAAALETSPGALLDGPPRVPTQDQLAAMLEAAQNEVGLEALTLGGYPAAVASGLHARLLQFAGIAPNVTAAFDAQLTGHAGDAQSPKTTRKDAQG